MKYILGVFSLGALVVGLGVAAGCSLPLMFFFVAALVTAPILIPRSVKFLGKGHQLKVPEQTVKVLPGGRPQKIFRMPQALTCSVSPRHSEFGMDPHTNHITEQSAAIFFVPVNIDKLLPLLPTADFELRGNTVTIAAVNMTNLMWLGGLGYNATHVTIAVKYKGEPMSLSIAMWENAVDPIVTGREELGFQKLSITQPSTWTDSDSFGFQILRNGETIFKAEGKKAVHALDPKHLLYSVKKRMINYKSHRGPDTCIVRALPLEDDVEVIRSRTNSTNGLSVHEVYQGGATVNFIPQKLPEENQTELIEWFTNLEPVGPVGCLYIHGNNGPRCLDQVVMDSISKRSLSNIPSLVRFTGSQGRIKLGTPRTTDRVVIECEADAKRLATLVPTACSSKVILTLSSYTMWGRPMKSMRLTVPVDLDSSIVIAQFDNDPDFVYTSREQIGAPSCISNITMGKDAIKATWEHNVSDVGGKNGLSFEFFTAKMKPSTDSKDGVIGDLCSKATLLHDYAMTAPGDSRPGGNVGAWGTHKKGKRLIRLTEEVTGARNLQALSMSMAFKPTDSQGSAVWHMLFTNLSTLGLIPVAATSFTADIALTFA